MTIETQLDDARLANATLREKLRRVIEERDELKSELMHSEFETQKQRHLKSECLQAKVRQKQRRNDAEHRAECIKNERNKIWEENERLKTCPVCNKVDPGGLEACSACYNSQIATAGKKKDNEVARLTQREFDELLDYSCTIPTGKTIGKKWKCRNNYYDASKGWIMGEYVSSDIEGMIDIRWTPIEIKDNK